MLILLVYRKLPTGTSTPVLARIVVVGTSMHSAANGAGHSGLEYGARVRASTRVHVSYWQYLEDSLTYFSLKHVIICFGV